MIHKTGFAKNILAQKAVEIRLTQRISRKKVFAKGNTVRNFRIAVEYKEPWQYRLGHNHPDADLALFACFHIVARLLFDSTIIIVIG